jgi:hypothetical protein
MMTDSAQPVRDAAWRELPRIVTHRTSAPTDAAIRATAAAVAGRRGLRTTADAVILAALRLAAPEGEFPEALFAEVERIESQQWTIPAPTPEPGS